MVKKPNKHTTLLLTGVLPEDTEASYVEEALAEKTIKVQVKTEEKSQDIFSGVVEKIEVSVRADAYHLTIQAVSHSIELDIVRVRRSYQKLSMTYEDLMRLAVKNFGGDVMDKATEGALANEFILQYDETAWEFIKRMVSRFELPLIVEDILDEPKVYAGLPNKGEIGDLEDFTYNVKKGVSNYRVASKDYETDTYENAFSHYELFSEKIFEIANKVNFKGRTLYVRETIIEMSEGIFKNIYKITDKSGFHVNRMRNEMIIGLSLEGEEIDVAVDDVQINLDIDKDHPPEENCWFKYSTPYTSDNGGGFYCMPEIGERIRLHFPTEEEAAAYSTSCIREEFEAEGERGDPDIKYWRSYAGKEIMFRPDGVKIRCLDDEIFIYMMEEDGILMQSNKPINIIANEGADIGMYAEGKIVMAAEEEFDAFSNGSRVNMRDGITTIRGNAIRGN